MAANPYTWIGAGFVPHPNITLPTAPSRPTSGALSTLAAAMDAKRATYTPPKPKAPPPPKPWWKRVIGLGELGLVVSNSESPPEAVTFLTPAQMGTTLKTGLNTNLPVPTQIVLPPAPPPQPFMQQYGHFVALGGGVLAGVLILKIAGSRR